MRRSAWAAWAVLAAPTWAAPAIKLGASDWERGIEIRASDHPDMVMFLWFYEHNLFDAVERGHNTSGNWRASKRSVDPAGARVTVEAPNFKLFAAAVEDGVTLRLEAVNGSPHDWPDVAGIIPCFNPGLLQNTAVRAPRNPQFADEDRSRTYFLGAAGLEKLDSREVHFNGKLRSRIELLSSNGFFAFSGKWPTAAVDARAGILIRESLDGKWVAGIAWDDFVSVNGHNPRKCMHVGVRVGPLARGASQSRRGKIYLFRGAKEECLRRMMRELPIPQAHPSGGGS